MDTFAKYVSAWDRRLRNRTHVCRAAKPPWCAIQLNDDGCLHRLVNSCNSLNAKDRPGPVRARAIRPINCCRHGLVFGISVLAGGINVVDTADFGFSGAVLWRITANDAGGFHQACTSERLKRECRDLSPRSQARTQSGPYDCRSLAWRCAWRVRYRRIRARTPRPGNIDGFSCARP